MSSFQRTIQLMLSILTYGLQLKLFPKKVRIGPKMSRNYNFSKNTRQTFTNFFHQKYSALKRLNYKIILLFSDEDFAFFSCAVSPGFDFADFVLSQKSELLGKFPQHAQIIQAFCRDE